MAQQYIVNLLAHWGPVHRNGDLRFWGTHDARNLAERSRLTKVSVTPTSHNALRRFVEVGTPNPV